ncbi:MAG: hypothetical protein V4462_09790, partial [Pseudomonadota bacterium]
IDASARRGAAAAAVRRRGGGAAHIFATGERRRLRPFRQAGGRRANVVHGRRKGLEYKQYFPQKILNLPFAINGLHYSINDITTYLLTS